MIDVKQVLFEISEDEGVYEDEYDLFENDVLDSLAIIELFTVFEDNGIEIQITQIDRSRLRTPRLIEELVAEYN